MAELSPPPLPPEGVNSTVSWAQLFQSLLLPPQGECIPVADFAPRSIPAPSPHPLWSAGGPNCLTRGKTQSAWTSGMSETWSSGTPLFPSFQEFEKLIGGGVFDPHLHFTALASESAPRRGGETSILLCEACLRWEIGSDGFQMGLKRCPYLFKLVPCGDL